MKRMSRPTTAGAMQSMAQLMSERDISQSAPVVVQRATGHERIETYRNSSPIIHSVFHNSVENQGAQNAISVLFATYLPDIKVLRPIFLWILAKNPINGADPKRGR